MRTRITLSALLLAATAVVSCNKESRSGSISFVANSSGFEEPVGTRTVFTGSKVGSVERIDWTEGDVIRIYCGEASMREDFDEHDCNYTVTGTSSPSEAVCSATINPASELGGMQWGIGPHKFYAMYPSPDTEGLKGASFVGGTMVFTMPATQKVTRSGDTGTWLPDMKYAPMLAEVTVEPHVDSVPLNFSPQYSAFTFTVNKANYDIIHLKDFTLTATTGFLTGTYTVESRNYSAVAGIENGGQRITVDLSGVVLDASTPTLTLTVMAIPQNYSGLAIGFTGDEIGTRSLALSYSDGRPIPFAAYKKFNIKGLSFPDGVVTLGRIDWDGSMYAADSLTITWDGTTYTAGVSNYTWDGNSKDASTSGYNWDN